MVDSGLDSRQFRIEHDASNKQTNKQTNVQASERHTI